MSQFFSDLFTFAVSILRHWQAYATGGVVTGLVGVFERLSGWKLTKRAYFYLFVIVFLLVAFFFAWRDQYREKQQLNAKLQTVTQELEEAKRKSLPEFRGDVDLVHFYEPVDSDYYFVTLNVTILNTGAPSIARGWALKAKAAGKPEIEGEKVFVNNEGFENLADLAVASPIPTGGQVAGQIVFRFSRQQISPEALAAANVILKFIDIRGKSYSVESIMVGERMYQEMHTPGINDVFREITKSATPQKRR